VPLSRWSSWRILLLSGVVASFVSAQERLRGWLCGSFLFGRRPYVDSRVHLTEGRRMHSSGRGDVLSSRAPTAPGMVLQCPGWWHNGGDGRTGPEVTEKTRSTSLTSRCRPAWVRGWRPYLFRGFRRPLSRGATWRPYRSGWHSVTELTPAVTPAFLALNKSPNKSCVFSKLTRRAQLPFKP
jgi:hypothetical protein